LQKGGLPRYAVDIAVGVAPLGDVHGKDAVRGTEQAQCLNRKVPREEKTGALERDCDVALLQEHVGMEIEGVGRPGIVYPRCHHALHRAFLAVEPDSCGSRQACHKTDSDNVPSTLCICALHILLG